MEIARSKRIVRSNTGTRCRQTARDDFRYRHVVGTCDAINTWHGRGDLALGQYQGINVGDPRDHSVTIITAGHPHGLVHLMRDPKVAELVRAKVDRWGAMENGQVEFPGSPHVRLLRRTAEEMAHIKEELMSRATQGA